MVAELRGEPERCGELALAVGDASAGQIVGRELYGDLIAGKNTNEELSHLSGNIGQEFLTVLEGSITVFLEGRDAVHLEQGDSIYFDSSLGHLYASAGEEDARILVVCVAT
mgnify:CR=1 FL=1